MKSENQIKQFAKEIRFKPDADVDERILACAEPKLAKSTGNQDVAALRRHSIRKKIMNSPITKLAAAAVIIIACVIGVSFWRTTGSGIVLADVLERVEQVKSFRFKMSVTENVQIAQDKHYQFEVRCTPFLISREYGYKINAETRDPNGGWMPYADTYISDEKKLCVVIAHTERKYVCEELDDYAETQESQEEDWNDPSNALKAIMACKYENLDRSTIDDMEVVGFHTTDPNFRSPLIRYSNPQVDIKLWVDVKTRLPVRFEEFSSSVDQRGNTNSRRQVVHDFEWNVPVTAAEFEPPPVPDGYTVMNVPRLNSEETAIHGLKYCVELFGNYLENISDDAGATRIISLAFEKSETPVALRLKEEIKGLTEDEKLDRVTDAADPIYRLIWFFAGLVQQKKDPAYYGKNITPKDADKVLLRWKLSDKEYRVICGDLHVETITPEKLKELEKALPK